MRVAIVTYFSFPFFFFFFFSNIACQAKTILNPVFPEFGPIIREHFGRKRQDILLQLKRWRDECTVGGSATKRPKIAHHPYLFLSFPLQF